MTESLLEQFAPRPDFTLRRRTILAAPADTVYRAVGELRPGDVHSPLLLTLLWVRGLPELLHEHHRVPAFEEVLLGDKTILLGERPGHEIVLGAAGRFWTPVMDWYDVTPGTFRSFTHEHSATIALAFTVEPLQKNRTSLQLETRVTVSDLSVLQDVKRYWRAIEPAARLTIRALLRAISSLARPTVVSSP